MPEHRERSLTSCTNSPANGRATSKLPRRYEHRWFWVISSDTGQREHTLTGKRFKSGSAGKTNQQIESEVHTPSVFDIRSTRVIVCGQKLIRSSQQCCCRFQLLCRKSLSPVAHMNPQEHNSRMSTFIDSSSSHRTILNTHC